MMCAEFSLFNVTAGVHHQFSFPVSIHWHAYWKTRKHVPEKKAAYSKHYTLEVNYSIDPASDKVTS